MCGMSLTQKLLLGVGYFVQIRKGRVCKMNHQNSHYPEEKPFVGGFTVISALTR